MKRESGQALVLVLLSLAVVLTLVLFVLSRSVTDVAVSSNQEQAVRAFSAAEAGVEKALVIGSGTGLTSIGDANYTSSVTSFAQGSNTFNYPIQLSSGNSLTTWFVVHDSTTGNAIDPNTGQSYCDGTHPCFAGNNIKICWGRPGTSPSSSTTPAIELSVVYEATPGDLSTARIARAAFDPYISRSTPNSFSAIDSGACNISGVSYAFQKSLTFSSLGILPASYNVPGGLQFARIKMLYNTDTNHEIGIDVSGGSPLPSQGQDIISTGTAGSTTVGLGSTRKIEVFQGWPEIPNIFEYSIYSSSGLTK